MTYRKDIQILRGIAVLLVVLYHFGTLGFQSGFLGVDVFFVISGFLMAVLYDANNKLDFFKKRALRLLPAYFVTIFLTVLAALVITIPNEFNQVFTQSILANIFLSNIGYWLQNSYFSKAEFNVFLHLWSLGVEIQFYLIIPILVYFFNLNKLLFWLAFIASILLCFAMIGITPQTSFFMMPLRLWEFLIGFGVAYYVMPNRKVNKNLQRIGHLGLLLIIAIPLFNVDGQSLSLFNGHPAIYALIISLATGAVLWFGIGNVQNSIFGTILECIGKYSYSIYLVHFPVVVLFLYQPFSGTQIQIEHVSDLLWIIVITTILSYFLYQLAEVKLRQNQHIKPILWLAPIVLVGLTVTGSMTQKQFYTDQELKISNAFLDRSDHRCGKINRLIHRTAHSCLIGKNKNSSDNVFLVGNSYADSIKTAFVKSANKHNITTYFIFESRPLMRGRGAMKATDIIDEALSRKVNHIVLHYSLHAIDTKTIALLVDLSKKHNIFVSFVMPPPTYDVHIPKALWLHEQDKALLPMQTKSDYELKTARFYKALGQIESASTHLKIYPVVDYFCKKKCKIKSDDNMPLYFDTGHLTLTGAKMLSSLFESIVLKHKTQLDL